MIVERTVSLWSLGTLKVSGVSLTPALAAWIRGAHDDGRTPLTVFGGAGDRAVYLGQPDAIVAPSGEDGVFYVAPDDGSDLSPTEEREVQALLAAHAVEPLKMPRE